MKIQFTGVVVTVFWSTVILLSGLLAFNALHYYTFSPLYGILPEKVIAFKNWIWTFSFYIHMGAGVICLFVPIVLFIGEAFNLSKIWHRRLGKLYVFDTLLIIVPTGLYMAFFAKGGTSTQIGFVVQGLALALSTVLAVRYIKQGELVQHKQWMMRSYSFAFAVITFRVLHICFYELKVPYELNYQLSQWVAVLFNALVVEIIILYQLKSNSKLIIT